MRVSSEIWMVCDGCECCPCDVMDSWEQGHACRVWNVMSPHSARREACSSLPVRREEEMGERLPISGWGNFTCWLVVVLLHGHSTLLSSRAPLPSQLGHWHVWQVWWWRYIWSGEKHVGTLCNFPCLVWCTVSVLYSLYLCLPVSAEISQ